MRRLIPLIAAVLAVLPAPAFAVSVFTTVLSGANEVPPNASTAAGNALVTLSDDESQLTVHVEFEGLTAPSAAAHIHCCVLPGANAPVRLDFGGIGFPLGVTAGVFDSGILNLSDVVVGITVAEFIAGLKGGLAYVNIHNAVFPGGEIRGQLAIPEPAIGGLLLLGIGLLAASRRR